LETDVLENDLKTHLGFRRSTPIWNLQIGKKYNQFVPSSVSSHIQGGKKVSTSKRLGTSRHLLKVKSINPMRRKKNRDLPGWIRLGEGNKRGRRGECRGRRSRRKDRGEENSLLGICIHGLLPNLLMYWSSFHG